MKESKVCLLTAVSFLTMVIGNPREGCAGEDYSKWSYSRSVIFDTTAAGAAVQGDVRDIPIPLRLDLSTMPGASANGADIRFAKADGTPVPHQIERWDDRGKRAEVWVLLDVVKGDTRAEAVRMYRGNPSTQDASDGTKVFDMSKGCLGVWHLNESGGSRPGGYRDSSGNQAHGTGVNLADTAGVAGVIAGGQNFKALLTAGEGAMIRVDPAKKHTFNVKSDVTVAAWVKLDKWENFFETIASKGDTQWRLSRVTKTDTLEFCNDQFRPDGSKVLGGGGVGPGKRGIADGRWHYLVGTSGKSHDLYIDGQLDVASKPRSPEGAPKATDYDVLIGANSQIPKTKPPRNFTGILDEVVILIDLRISNAIVWRQPETSCLYETSRIA